MFKKSNTAPSCSNAGGRGLNAMKRCTSNPVNTDDITLSDGFLALTEHIKVNVHDEGATDCHRRPNLKILKKIVLLHTMS